MIIEAVIRLLQKEDPHAEEYIVRLGKSHTPQWSLVAGGMVQLQSPDILRRVVAIEARDGCVLFIQEDVAILALADR